MKSCTVLAGQANGANVTNAYDSVARLLNTTLRNSGGTLLNLHNYGYNAGSQRTHQVFTAGNYVNYTYDNMGQLTSASGRESAGAPRIRSIASESNQ